MINAQEDGKEENNGNGNGNGIHVTCSKSELRLCSDMIQSAQRDYISLQNGNKYIVDKLSTIYLLPF